MVEEDEEEGEGERGEDWKGERSLSREGGSWEDGRVRGWLFYVDGVYQKTQESIHCFILHNMILDL